ncbi:hypothetical protein I6N90_18700 [Paenibacillus sp. GSMTC-2017]|uniref:hypothetical protein n=1 Tax=Paenibacillus sp. GSMTC-2017 TaxID=2794350 RepID=UPI0018D9495E|nr:hypothetical protein [Paenibacillus sp. GSMTC-2017]MBH5319833.1 hypothetical protein [Paenibacillus sp. GSMTC-2017]
MNRMDAGHLSIEQLLAYVNNGLDERGRELVDQELLVCEQCMGLFMTVMEDSGDNTIYSESYLPDFDQLEERVIGELMITAVDFGEKTAFVDNRLSQLDGDKDQTVILSQQSLSSVRKKRGSWLGHPIMQYTIAASITLLLLATGVLAEFSGRLQSLDGEKVAPPPFVAHEEWKEDPTWSDRMLNHTSNWIDDLQQSRFNN